MSQAESRYLTFRRASVAGRKTDVVYVHSRSSGVPLGKIAWFGRWRQFCFYPEATTVFNSGCMADIQKVIAELMEERKQ